MEWLWRASVRRGVFHPGTVLGRLVLRVHSPFDAFELASAAVGRGNLKVFAEIGLAFARYFRDCPPDALIDSAEVTAFLAWLRPGDPPDGQEYNLSAAAGAASMAPWISGCRRVCSCKPIS